MKHLIFSSLLIMGVCVQLRAQHEYHPPKDPLVIKKLADWQDQKFGLFMHWGPYSQWGVSESWTICPDEWVTRSGPYSHDYFDLHDHGHYLEL
jgi:alpha-L-fucosidase